MVRLVVATILSSVTLVHAASTVAGAQTTNGLQVASSTTYVPQPELEQVAVNAVYTLTNLQPDENLDGRIRSYYYTKWVIAVPASVRDLSASTSQQPLRTTNEVDADTQDVAFVSIDLLANLSYQESVQIDVRYTIPGGEPRAGGVIARVNDSFLSFSVWTAGDPGLADVRIQIPPGFTVDLQGDLDEFREITRDGETLLEATSIKRPHDFFGQVFGRNDLGLLTEIARLPVGTATVRAWPDDPEWAIFVVDAIEEDVPVLADLTGLDWTAGDIEVIETVTPYLYGYGGWFNASSGLIEVGETLERDLILHELAHAWFNDELIEGRWITEGMAEEFASQTIAATGDPQPDPIQPDLADPLRVPLADWASPWTLDEADAFAYEQYHYNASWWVIRQITDEIGLDAFADVLVALRDDVLPYPGELPGEKTLQPTSWTHLFDLLDSRTDSANLDELFTTYVLDPDVATRLELRRTTLDQYDDLVMASAMWSPPLVLRRDLTAWNFDNAQTLIAEVNTIISVRDAVDTLAADLDIDIVHDTEAAYETATSLTALRAVRSTEEQLRTDLEGLRTARTDLLDQGAALHIGVEFSAGTQDAAAAEIVELRASLEHVAMLRVQVEEKVDAMDLTHPDWSLPSSADAAVAAADAEARLATLDAIERATSSVNAPRSLLQQLGVWRRDPSHTLADARRAFEADALDDALAATAATETALARADSQGRTRALYASAAVIAILGAVATTTWFRHQRASGPASNTNPLSP